MMTFQPRSFQRGKPAAPKSTPSPTIPRLVIALLLCSGLAAATGCHRSYYRRQADQEAYSLIAEKTNHPHWALEHYEIDLDPRSRMFDPFDPDHPPMPPDDPAAHQLMHLIDHKKGYPGWHCEGDTPYVENPVWWKYLGLNDDGELVLDAAEAVKLALIHSPDYQSQLETLYLSALDVSAERFRFDTQYFAGYGVNYTTSGRLAPGSGGNSRSILDLSTRNVRANRLYSTGADLTVGLANSLIWQLSGPDTHTASTLLDFTLVQPLLRGAGRDRVLERLTIAERGLLANVRLMERYQRGFFLDVYTGEGGQSGPQRRGGFFGGSGLEGFSGVGGGGFGRIGGGGGGGFGGGGGVGAGTAGGYLGLLQTQQTIRNQVANITALRSSLAQLEALYEGGRIGAIQVEQVRQQVFRNTSALITSQRGYADSLDNFKRQLGLPPQIEIVVEDSLLDEIQLIDPEIVPVQDAIADLQERLGDAIIEFLDNPVDELDADAEQKLKQIQAYLAETSRLGSQILEQNVPRAEADIAELREALPTRMERAAEMRQRINDLQQGGGSQSEMLASVDPSLFDLSGIADLPDELRLGKLQANGQRDDTGVNKIVEEINAVRADAEALVQELEQLMADRESLTGEQFQARLIEILLRSPSLLITLSDDTLRLSLVQAEARSEAALLVPVDMTPEVALEIARRFRRDWMNARANLVDSWRLIEFNADNLEAFLDVVFSGDIRNTGDNPIRLRDATGNLRVGLQFDAPITRLLERNTYRQALIEYQQARRSYYQVEDAIARGLRAILRQLELNQINFELRRSALRVAIDQVRLARLELERPPEISTQGRPLGNETVAINLINSLNDLRGAQDDFLSVWINYYVQRGLLDLNLGTMQLDSEGLWIDPGPIGLKYGYPVSEIDEVPLGPCPVPFQFQSLDHVLLEQGLRDGQMEEIEPAMDGQIPWRPGSLEAVPGSPPAEGFRSDGERSAPLPLPARQSDDAPALPETEARGPATTPEAPNREAPAPETPRGPAELQPPGTEAPRSDDAGRREPGRYQPPALRNAERAPGPPFIDLNSPRR